MKLKKAMVVFSTVCILSTMITGCGSSSESTVKTGENQAKETLPEESKDAPLEGVDGSAEEPQENTAGRWQVLEPDVAAAVDADFLGKVWKMEENSFFIAEKKVKILDDGSLSYSSPSSNADLPETELIHLFFEEDTLSGQRDTRFCTADLRFCCVTVAQRTSSTLRSSALQNHKSVVQNSSGPQVPSFGGWQGNGMRRTGRTPIDVNAASRQKTVLGACIPLSTEGTVFYMRTTDGSGENHEDKEAGFQDLKEHMSVEMKGSFKNDEFHATEIRFF